MAPLSPISARPGFAVVAGPGFDARWAQWLARGTAHERVVRRRFQVVFPLLVVAAASAYVLWP